jgi:hypothetical protein
MKLFDAIYNWLQIKVVAEARPDDQAAQDTYAFFSQILTEDHQVQVEEVIKDETMYRVVYLHEGKKKTQMFERESVDFLLEHINAEPKFNE